MEEIDLHVDLTEKYRNKLLNHGCKLTLLNRRNIFEPLWVVKLPEGTKVEWEEKYAGKTIQKLVFPDGFYFTWVYNEQDGKRYCSLNIPGNQLP